MTKEDLAQIMNGRRIGEEITQQEEAQAKGSALVAIFGASDDLIELRGAIHDEVNAYKGGECFIKNGKLLEPLEDEADIEVLEKYGVLEIVQKMHKGAIRIEGKFGDNVYSWFITTEAEFVPFEIMEGADKYCRGIVIQL